jgi:hypothetical protein
LDDRQGKACLAPNADAVIAAHHPLRRAWASIGQWDLLDGGQTRGRFETWTLIARAT